MFLSRHCIVMLQSVPGLHCAAHLGVAVAVGERDHLHHNNHHHHHHHHYYLRAHRPRGREKGSPEGLEDGEGQWVVSLQGV